MSDDHQRQGTKRRQARNDQVLWAAVGCTFIACTAYAILASSVIGMSRTMAAVVAIAIFVIGVAGAWVVLTRQAQRAPHEESQATTTTRGDTTP